MNWTILLTLIVCMGSGVLIDSDGPRWLIACATSKIPTARDDAANTDRNTEQTEKIGKMTKETK